MVLWRRNLDILQPKLVENEPEVISEISSKVMIP